MNKKNRLIFSVILAACAIAPCCAQESFADFRKRLISDYNEFRASIFENYDKFLEGAWSDFEQMKAERSNPRPKPHKAPIAPAPELPAPTTPITVAPRPQEPAPQVQEPSRPELPREETPTVLPVQKPISENDRFTIGETELSVPHVDYNITKRLDTPQDYAAHWRAMTNSEIEEVLVPGFKELARQYGLNDYLLYEAVNAYVDSRYPQAHSSARKSMAHYILTALGYDVRLGKSDDGTGMLLVPFKQMVYARPYLNIDGKKYFIFADSDVDLRRQTNMRISSCKLPSDAESGAPLDLVLKDLRLPYQPGTFKVSYDGLEISGEFNKAIIPLLYRYPQMPTGDYSRSNVLPEVRQQIVAQLKDQLGQMDKDEAVDRLLQFVQHGFDYAYDEDYHGFEKPYFLEETLFYPKNDCEDRAIFYTYLLWEVLGVPNQMICYPGHESASVTLENTPKLRNATSYKQNGTTYYISDPTYIGAITGMCMPDYESETPVIDFTYE